MMARNVGNLDRFENLSEQTNVGMINVMIREIESRGGDTSDLKNALPDHTWDDTYRKAGACMMEKYTALI
ncbi:MAG: hypothetical protein ACPG77_12255, partial [Nannocystaceae bacterium]